MEDDQEYTDDYEKRAVELTRQLTKKNFRKNAHLFREAASEIIKSANPEAKAIYDFMLGMSKQQEAKSEADPHKAIKLLDEALEHLEKFNWENIISDERIETRILKLKKEIDINRKDFSKFPDLFFGIATEENKRGNDKAYHVNMGLYHLYNGVGLQAHDPATGLKEIDLALKMFNEVGDIQFVHKILGIKYRILAQFQPTYEARLALFNKAREEIEQTKDKYGLNEIRGSICYISAQRARDWSEKANLFKEASEYYRKDNFLEKYHHAIGMANLWEIHNESLTLEKSIFIVKKAQSHFRAADDQREFYRATGFLFLLKAIKEGIIQRKDKALVSNLAQANHHFARCQDAKYVNLTAGLVLFTQAISLSDESSEKVFKKSAEILETIKEGLYHLAYYQYYRIEAHQSLHNYKYSHECLENAAKHLESWIESLQDRPVPKDDRLIPPNFNMLIPFWRAETYHLKGIVEKNQSKRAELFKAALQSYDEIIAANFLSSRAWRAKGWTYMFLNELDKAHDAFLTAYELDPTNKSIQQDIQFAANQLKKGFRDLREILRAEYKVSRELRILLAGKIGKLRHMLIPEYEDLPGQDFYQRAINWLQRAGRAIEENYDQHRDKDEEGLRDEMIQCLKMYDSTVTAESKKAKGKRDINIKDDFSDKELTAECLIWKGRGYYEGKKNQLFERYLTWHNREAVLITFVRNPNFISIVSLIPEEIRILSDIIEGSFQDLSHETSRLYVSEHKHKSGVTIRLYHIFLHLPLNGETEN